MNDKVSDTATLKMPLLTSPMTFSRLLHLRQSLNAATPRIIAGPNIRTSSPWNFTGYFRGQSFSSSTEDEDEKAEAAKVTRDNLKQSPELQKLLSDLYEDVDENDSENADVVTPKPQNPDILASFTTKFDEYRDADSPIIYDVDEELAIMREMKEKGVESKGALSKVEVLGQKLKGFNLEHGVSGVFDIGELVDVLRRENCFDIIALTVPKHINYVDFIVVASCRSSKHVVAVAEFTRKLFKQKMDPKCDKSPNLEGCKKMGNWIALDLGNIALHFFHGPTRQKYDIEALWALGPELDGKSKGGDDAFDDFLKKNQSILDLKPLYST